MVAPGNPQEVSTEGAKNVEIVVAHREIVSRSHVPDQARGKRGGKLDGGKRGGGCLDVLNPERASRLPVQLGPKFLGNKESPVIEQEAGRTEVAAGDAGRGCAGLKISIVAEAEIAEAVFDADVRTVGAHRFADLEIDTPTPIGIEIAARVSAVGIAGRNVIAVSHIRVAHP